MSSVMINIYALNTSRTLFEFLHCSLLTVVFCLFLVALDAYVLLELYDKLVELARKQDPTINVEPPISMKWLKPSKNEKRRAKQRGEGKQKSSKKWVILLRSKI